MSPSGDYGRHLSVRSGEGEAHLSKPARLLTAVSDIPIVALDDQPVSAGD